MGRMRPHGATDALLQWQADCLLHGVPLLNCPGGMKAAADWRLSPAAAKAWRQHKRELLARWREMQADGRVEPDRECYGRARFDHGQSDAEFWRASEERHQRKHAEYERKQAEAAELRKRAREEKLNAERTIIQ